MREFFRGWRRKAGLAALATALLLMTGWMRSYIIRDAILIRYPGAHHFVLSTSGGIGWLNYAQSQSEPKYLTQWRSTKTPGAVTADHLGGLEVARRWEWCGFSVGSAAYPPHSSRPAQLEIWIAPYWPLVLPLTLLSAWLLLIKPGPAKSAKESSHA